MQVHPTYDPKTRTWFLEGYQAEAPTISQLLQKLPPHIRRAKIKDYYVMQDAPTPRFRLSTIEEFMKRPDRPHMHTPKSVVTALIPRARASKSGESRGIVVDHPARRRKKAKPRQNKRRLSLRPKEWVKRSPYSFTPEEKLQVESQILDLWARGNSGPEIAFQLKLRTAYVSANVIPKYRLLGDPRAAIRNPKTFGKHKY